MAKKNSRKSRKEANKKMASNNNALKNQKPTKDSSNKPIIEDISRNNNEPQNKDCNKKKFWTKKKKIIAIICVPVLLAIIFCSIFIPISISNAEKQLASPYITLNAGKISWNKVKNATVYDIYANSKRIDQTVDYSYDLTGLESGSYEVFIVAKAVGKKYAESNRVTYVKTKLAAPVIMVFEDKVSWNPIENAVGYEVYFDGKLHTTITECEYVPDISDGKIIITVKALGNEIDYGKSDFSNEEEFNKIKAPHISLSDDGKYISWQAVDNARGYIVLINDVENLIEETQIELPSGIGKFVVKIKAIASDRYVSSDFSNEYEFVRWGEISKVTNVSSEDNLITFDLVNGAYEYEVYVKSFDESEFVLVGKTKTNSYLYENIEYGYYKVKIKAIADESKYYRGYTYSDEYEMRYLERLATPEVSLPNGQDILSWEAVLNAISYDIYNNEELLFSGVTDLSINLADGFYKLNTVGYYSLTVVAVSDWINYANSNPSNKVDYVVFTRLEKPIISLANDTITITPVDNADYYNVYVDEQFYVSSDDTTINLGLKCSKDEPKKYSVYVVAKANDENLYKDSIHSELYRIIVSGAETKVSQGEISFNSTGYELNSFATGLNNISLNKTTQSYQSVYGTTGPYYPLNDPTNPTCYQIDYGYLINENSTITITTYSVTYVQIFYRGTGSGRITFGQYSLVELDSPTDTMSTTTMAISAGTYELKSTKNTFIMKIIITTDKTATNYNYDVYSKEELASRIRIYSDNDLSNNATAVLEEQKDKVLADILSSTDMNQIEGYYNEFLIFVEHLATKALITAALAEIPNDDEYIMSEEQRAFFLTEKANIEAAVYIDDINLALGKIQEEKAKLVKKTT